MPPTLYSTKIATPFGTMLAVGDDEALHLLEFETRKDLPRQLAACGRVAPGRAASLDSITAELKAYSKGQLKRFKTKCHFYGTPFQQRAWRYLLKIPFAQTRFYGEQAQEIGSAARAVGQANARNRLAIIVPCHRVCNKAQGSGGYAAGEAVKSALLAHEAAAAA